MVKRKRWSGEQKKISVSSENEAKVIEMAEFYDVSQIYIMSTAFEEGLEILWLKYLSEVERSEKKRIADQHRQLLENFTASHNSIDALIIQEMIKQNWSIEKFAEEADVSIEELTEALNGGIPEREFLSDIRNVLTKPSGEQYEFRELIKLVYNLDEESNLKPNGVNNG